MDIDEAGGSRLPDQRLRDRIIRRYSEKLYLLDYNKEKQQVDQGVIPFSSYQQPEKHPDQDSCSINQGTIKCKLLFFFFFGARASIEPYLAVYFKQLGLAPSDIGLLYSVRPLLSLVFSPLFGWMADRYNATRIMIYPSLLSWSIFVFAMGFIPQPHHIPCSDAHITFEELFGHRALNVCLYKSSYDHYTYSTGKYNPIQENTENISIEHFHNQEISPITSNNVTLFAQSTTISYMGYNNSDSTMLLKTVNSSIVSTRRSHDETKESIEEPDSVLCTSSTSWLYSNVDLQRILLIAMSLNIVGEIFQAPAPAIMNTAILNTLGEENHHQFGYQRAFGSASSAFMNIVSGLLLDWHRAPYNACGMELSQTDYMPVFTFYLILMTLTIPVMYFFDVQSKDKEKTSYDIKVVYRGLCNIRYGLVLFICMWMGLCNGLVKAFSFWYIEALGGSSSLASLTNLAATFASTVGLIVMPRINNACGYIKPIFIGIIFQGLNYFGYAIMENPWWAILPNIIKGFSAAITYQTLAAFMAESVPTEYLCTMQSVMWALYYGFGSGVGGILGGVAFELVGPVATFWAISIISFFFAFLFIFIHWLCSRTEEEAET